VLAEGAKHDRCVPIYQAAAGGRKVPLLKTLVSSHCTNNCAYCVWRCDRRTGRTRFEPGELADIALKLWRRRVIEGVFLSSSVARDPDAATSAEIETSEILRARGYTGYLHLRIMPGTSRELVARGVQLADRVGLNIENPDPELFAELKPGVDFKRDLWERLRWCHEEAKKYQRFAGPGFARAGLDTQFVVGASEETDEQIIDMTHRLTNELGMRRVYYSTFEPIARTPLENHNSCPSFRGRRLYQVSFLIRDYGFESGDFEPALDERGLLHDVDPKLALARTHPELYPVDLNAAPLKELLLVPGIGPRTANAILAARARMPFKSISDAQKAVGARIKSAAPYLNVGRARQVHIEKFCCAG
jgi:predicted DNA-binding helix-hairpin-helix protein